MNASSFLSAVRARVGAESCEAEEAAARHTVRGQPPLAVVSPRTPDDAAALLALCSDEGWPVRPAGAGTWLQTPAAAAPASAEPAGSGGTRLPLVITTTRLTGVLEHEPADLVVGVRAGMPLADLQRHVAAAGQWLPLDPPGAAPATIGAALALASAGPLRAGHGTPRDLTLGIEVATGDGRVLRFGGRVVKNVAGYDGVRMLVGSRGTLGIITAAYLRLRGAPRADETWLLPAGGPAHAAELALEVRSLLACDALELLSPGLAAEVLGNRAGGDGWCVLARVTGSRAAVGEAGSVLRGLAGPPDAAAVRPTGTVTDPLDPAAAADAWRRLAAAEAGAPTGAAGTGLAFRAVDLPDRLAGTLLGVVAAAAALQAAAGRDNARSRNDMGGWRVAAHGVDGIVRAWGPAPAADGPAPRILEECGAAITGGGGTWTCTGCPPAWTAVLTRPEPDPVVTGLTRRLMQAFDPAGVLLPGRELP